MWFNAYQTSWRSYNHWLHLFFTPNILDNKLNIWLYITVYAFTHLEDAKCFSDPNIPAFSYEALYIEVYLLYACYISNVWEIDIFNQYKLCVVKILQHISLISWQTDESWVTVVATSQSTNGIIKFFLWKLFLQHNCVSIETIKVWVVCFNTFLYVSTSQLLIDPF